MCSPCRRGCLRIEGSAGWWLAAALGRVAVGLASIAAGGRGHELSHPKLPVVDPDRVSCYNICRTFKFMTIMSATNREGGGSGHGSGRVGSGTAWVGSGQIIGS